MAFVFLGIQRMQAAWRQAQYWTRKTAEQSSFSEILVGRYRQGHCLVKSTQQ